jgi:hypothetical protein
MKKILLVALLGLVLGGCKKDSVTNSDYHNEPSMLFVKFYLVDENDQSLFVRNEDYSGHPYDPKLFKAHGATGNHNLGELRYLRNELEAEVIFSISETLDKIRPNFLKEESDTLMIWYACWGNKCDTITMRNYNWREIQEQNIVMYYNAAKWIAYNRDTIYDHITDVPLRIPKILY